MVTVSVVIPTQGDAGGLRTNAPPSSEEVAVEVRVVEDPKAGRSRSSRSGTIRMPRDASFENPDSWSPAWQMIDADLPVADALDALMGQPGLTLLSPSQMVRLSEELGGSDAVWDWIERRASQADRPIAVLVEGDAATRYALTVVGPQEWSEDRLTRSVVAYLIHVDQEPDEVDGGDGATLHMQSVTPSDHTFRDTVDTDFDRTDQELDEVSERLTARLQGERPDLFDDLGRPQIGALERAVQKRTGKQRLSRADILELLRKQSS